MCVLNKNIVPQAVWLFAPDPNAAERVHPDIIAACHEHGFKVFVQVGTVAAAREAVQDGADVIVAQGIDAGGHQFASGAGIVSLVPEIRAWLREQEGQLVRQGREVVLVAAGGISDGNGVVGAIALGESFFFFFCQQEKKKKKRKTNNKLLGADGVVLGTKLIPAKEANTPEAKKKAILETEDGGRTTVK